MKLLCFNPHNDDTIISLGGTIIKLLNNDWDVGYVYLTDGRHGSDILSPEETLKIRAEEGKKEREFLGIKSFWDIGVEDGTLELLSDTQKKQVQEKLLSIIESFKPDVVLVPSLSELHPDHRSTHNIVIDIVREQNLNIPIMKFVLWGFPDLYKKQYDPCEKVVLVNIDKEFGKKIDAIKLHKSQDAEGRYPNMVSSFNSYLSYFFRTYQKLDFEKSEIIGFTNLSNQNKEVLENLLKGLENPIDITTIFHGRQEKKIKAQL